jgi:hypothetical protein
MCFDNPKKSEPGTWHHSSFTKFAQILRSKVTLERRPGPGRETGEWILQRTERRATVWLVGSACPVLDELVAQALSALSASGVRGVGKGD